MKEMIMMVLLGFFGGTLLGKWLSKFSVGQWACLCNAVNERWVRKCWNCGALRLHSERNVLPPYWLMKTRMAHRSRTVMFLVLFSFMTFVAVNLVLALMGWLLVMLGRSI